MPQATITHLAGLADLDAHGIYHPHVFLRLAQDAIATLKRGSGVLHELTERTRLHEFKLICHAVAGRDDSLEVTATVDEVAETFVVFGFEISTGQVLVAQGLVVEAVEGEAAGAGIPVHVRLALG